MTEYGIDEAWARLTPAEMKAAGRTFVVGYVGENTTGKNITRAEVRAYHDAGIAVLLVYEFSTTAVHGGAAAGMRNASLAVSQARALGYPAGCALGFAVDENTTGNPSIVDGYARGFTAGCHSGQYRSMDYGGLATVKRCADLGLADLHWQTYAWSGGRWDPRAAIRQVQNGVTIAGKDVDLDTAMVADFGAWMPGNPTPMGDDVTPDQDNVLREVRAVVRALFWGWQPTEAEYLAAGGRQVDWDEVVGGIGGNAANNLVPRLFAGLAAAGGSLTDEQVQKVVDSVPTAAEMMAAFDYSAFAAAVVSHVHLQ